MYPNLEDSLSRREQAKELYLYSDKSQKEIAAEVDVSDRTIRDWIKKYKWDELKYRMEHPPLTLSEGIRLQLTNLQNNILSKPSGTPNVDEVNIMHKLILCLYRLSTMPNYDPVIKPHVTPSPVILNLPFAGERSVGQENPLACPLENLPLSDEMFSTEKTEETTEILAPLNENEQLTQLPLPSKSGSETEKNEVISTPTSSGERSVGLIENESNTETTHLVSAAIEEQQLKAKLKAEELEKAKHQRENIRRFKDSMRWEYENNKRSRRW